MNHKKVYDALIENARSKNRKQLRKNNDNYIYYENHHIIPRCLGGNENKDNKVLLTAREHFICHKLLTYIYIGNRKLANAFFLLAFSKKNNKHYASARDFAYARELYRLLPVTDETKKRQSIAQQGHTLLPEARKKISDARKLGSSWNKNKRGCQVAWNKGLTKDTDQRIRKYIRYGEEHAAYKRIDSDEIRFKKGSSLRGKTYEEVYGKERALEIKISKSKSQIGKKRS